MYHSLKHVGFQLWLYFRNFEKVSLQNLLLQVEQRSEITAHPVTETPLLLAADAGLSSWTVIDGGMYHPASHHPWHSALMKYAVTHATYNHSNLSTRRTSLQLQPDLHLSYENLYHDAKRKKFW